MLLFAKRAEAGVGAIGQGIAVPEHEAFRVSGRPQRAAASILGASLQAQAEARDGPDRASCGVSRSDAISGWVPWARPLGELGSRARPIMDFELTIESGLFCNGIRR